MRPPCKGCRYRSVRPNCHTTCEDYQAYNAERERIHAVRLRDSIFIEYLKNHKRDNMMKKEKRGTKT